MASSPISVPRRWFSRSCPGVVRRPAVGQAAAISGPFVHCALILLLGGLARGSVHAADAFDLLHARLAAAESTRHTIRARFTETTTSSLLAKPLVARGTLVGEKSAMGQLTGHKPSRLLIRYTSPERKVILFEGDRLWVIRGERQGPERIDITQIMRNVNKYFTNATPDQLRRAFNVRAFVDPEMPAHYQIDLLPKRKQIKQGLERLQIWVRADIYMLAELKITFAGGDTDVFRLDDVELNAPVPPGTFDLGTVSAPPAQKRRAEPVGRRDD